MALVVIVTLLFTGAGVAAGLVRTAKYSATAKLAVLHLNFGSPLIAFQSDAEVLSDTYARSLTSDGVVRPLAAEFHTSAQTISSEIGARAIPQSPVFLVTARTPSPASSIALANAAMGQFISYLQKLNSANPDAPTLYAELKQAVRRLAAAQNHETAVKSSIQAAMAARKAGSMSPAEQAQASAAESAVDLDSDQASGMRTSYQQSLLGGSDTQYLQPLQSATITTSDRVPRLTLFAFIGLAVGTALATAMALLRQARLERRRTA